MEPTPSISRAFFLLLQEEQQRVIASLSPTAVNSLAIVIATSANNSKSTSTHKKRKNRPVCTHCKIPGHTVDKYYKIHGYPPEYKTRQQ